MLVMGLAGPNSNTHAYAERLNITYAKSFVGILSIIFSEIGEKNIKTMVE
jgi:hypothetical protein